MKFRLFCFFMLISAAAAAQPFLLITKARLSEDGELTLQGASSPFTIIRIDDPYEKGVLYYTRTGEDGTFSVRLDLIPARCRVHLSTPFTVPIVNVLVAVSNCPTSFIPDPEEQPASVPILSGEPIPPAPPPPDFPGRACSRGNAAFCPD